MLFIRDAPKGARAGPQPLRLSAPGTPSKTAAESEVAPFAPSGETAEALSRWFREQVQPHDGRLKAWLRGSFPSVRDVDDVVQESYLRIWKTRAARPIRSAKSFLFVIARNLAINVLRRQRVSPVIFDGDLAGSDVLMDEPSAAELLTEREKMELLSDALVALPARTRAIFILHKLEGQSQAGVACQLGITEKAVEHQVARAIRLCEAFIRSRGF